MFDWLNLIDSMLPFPTPSLKTRFLESLLYKVTNKIKFYPWLFKNPNMWSLCWSHFLLVLRFRPTEKVCLKHCAANIHGQHPAWCRGCHAFITVEDTLVQLGLCIQIMGSLLALPDPLLLCTPENAVLWRGDTLHPWGIRARLRAWTLLFPRLLVLGGDGRSHFFPVFPSVMNNMSNVVSSAWMTSSDSGFEACPLSQSEIDKNKQKWKPTFLHFG